MAVGTLLGPALPAEGPARVGPAGLGAPVALLTALPGAGGPGLPQLPGAGDLAPPGGAPAEAPGTGDGPGAGGKSRPGPGGLYVGVVGAFDMPMGVTTGDYQADAEGMPNLLKEVRSRTNIHVSAQERFVELTLDAIEHTPILHIRGHRPFSFSEQEREVLRQYVARGGTIFGEDSHGPFGECFRREMRKVFGKAPGDLPADHDLYRAHYVIEEVPAGDMGERYPVQGIDVGGRLGVIYSRNDYGDCWEGTGGWVKPESREPAFQMGTNIFVYVVAHWNKASKGGRAQQGAGPSR